MSLLTIGDRIWGGDQTVVAATRKAFKGDPVGQLVPYAVALYSFRFKAAYASELLALRAQLVERATKHYEHVPWATEHAVYVNQSDVLSTHLEWMSRRPEIAAAERANMRALAARLCEKAIPLANESAAFCLLLLTFTRIIMEYGQRGLADARLREIAAAADGIRDTKQRARVYRKLGMLYRLSGRRLHGCYWGIAACLVRDIPPAVRLKSLAALVGLAS